MTRVATAGEPVQVAPSNNVYTILSLIGVLSLLFAVIIMFVRARAMDIDLLKM